MPNVQVVLGIPNFVCPVLMKMLKMNNVVASKAFILMENLKNV